MAFQQARQALVAPRGEPPMDGGVANGKEYGQLVHRLAPVVAQHGLGAAALAGMAGVVAARVKGCDFFGAQDKGGTHAPKLLPPFLCDYFCTTT